MLFGTRPSSFALIGCDGAGKTTIARRLESEQPLLPMRVRYLYMGINRGSSNVTLPIDTLLKTAQRFRKVRGRSGPKDVWYWPLFRLTKHVAEECYRQLVSWMYRVQGYAVLYDRHFQFEFPPKGSKQCSGKCDRLHRWFLAKVYPRPDMVLFLDAPPDVLFARKHEAGIELLEARRRSFLEQGQRAPNFVRIDANRPLEVVYRDVVTNILTCSRQLPSRVAGDVSCLAGSPAFSRDDSRRDDC